MIGIAWHEGAYAAVKRQASLNQPSMLRFTEHLGNAHNEAFFALKSTS